LLQVDRGEWSAEVPEIRAFFERFGERLPEDLTRSLSALERDLAKVAVPR
jgi:GTP-dependent phosphoenolpyruvate carboxykinase